MISKYNQENSRIIKNSALLYMRMFISTLIALYTSRLTLQALGVEDYGIYNVVSGFISFFAFVNGSMVSATRRYLTIAIANNNVQNQKLVFSTSFYVHLFIGIVITIIASSVGWWFLEYKLIIPIEKLHTAFYIFIFSMINVFALCITVPHNALVVAYEKMGTFAYLSLIEVFLKLFTAIYITYYTLDKLFIYALFLCLISVFVRLLYVIYCHKNFQEVNYHIPGSSSLIRNMFQFAGWNLFPTMANSIYQHGITVLLNVFFSPTVNAARGIASQVQGLTYLMATNFQQAIDPQITKSYAKEDFKRLHILICSNAKISFFLVLILVVPICFETQFILSLWLGNVPDYTVPFVRISLFITLFDVISSPFTTAILATGKIRRYQLMSSIILLFTLPLSYLFLKLGSSPTSVYLVNVVLIGLLFYSKVYISSPIIQFPIKETLKDVVVPIIKVLVLTWTLCITFFYLIPNSESVFNVIVSLFITVLSILSLGLKSEEKKYLFNMLKSFFYKK